MKNSLGLLKNNWLLVPAKLHMLSISYLSFSLQPKSLDRIQKATTRVLCKVNKRQIEDHTQNPNKGMGVNLLGLFFPLIMGFDSRTGVVFYFAFSSSFDYLCISMSLRNSLSIFIRILGEILVGFLLNV